MSAKKKKRNAIDIDTTAFETQEVKTDTQPPRMQLTREELLEIKLLDAERQLAHRTLEVKLLQRAAMLKKLDPHDLLTKAQDGIQQATHTKDEADRACDEFSKKLEVRLGVSLQTHCYNDVTGELSSVD